MKLFEFCKDHWIFIAFALIVLLILLGVANDYLDAATGMLPGVEGTGI